MIKDRINARRHVIEHSRDVCDCGVDGEEYRRFGTMVFPRAVDGDQPLRVKRRPAYEERDHYCNCLKK